MYDVECCEKKKFEKHQLEIQRLQQQQYDHELLTPQQSNDNTNHNNKSGINSARKEEEEEQKQRNEDDVENGSNGQEVPETSLLNKPTAPNRIISSLFIKRSEGNDNVNNIIDGVSDISSIKSDTEEDQQNTEELQNRNLEALRKRIERMKSNQYDTKPSFKCVALSVLFIEYLKKMVDQHRPAIAIEFERNLSQISKPYQTLTCNYLKLYSLSVFRSIQRSKITLIGFNTKRIFSIFNAFKADTSSGDTTLYIRVHVLKLIECFNKYLQVLNGSLIEFFNSHLLSAKPALFKYCYVNETDLLQFDKYHFVINYNEKQKRMILLNFIAIRCMLLQVIFDFLERNLSKESTQKSNLFCLASVYYYIIRKYNTKLLECDNLIEQDTEITEMYIPDKFPKEKLLSDNHPIYDNLQDVIKDGMDKIDTLMDKLMAKIESHNNQYEDDEDDKDDKDDM